MIKRLAGNEDEIYESLANVPSLVNFIPEVVSSYSLTSAYAKYLIKTTFPDSDQYLILKILKLRHALVKIFMYLIHICGIKLPIFSTLALELLIASLSSDLIIYFIGMDICHLRWAILLLKHILSLQVYDCAAFHLICSKRKKNARIIDIKIGTRTFIEYCGDINPKMTYLEDALSFDPNYQFSKEELKNGINFDTYRKFVNDFTSSASIGFRIEGLSSFLQKFLGKFADKKVLLQKPVMMKTYRDFNLQERLLRKD